LPDLIPICELDASPGPGGLACTTKFLCPQWEEILPTFKEQQQALTEAQHKLAVWETLYKFLDDNFLAHDEANPRKAIAARDCLVEVVGSDSIEDVLDTIAKERISPLKKVIEGILGQEMVIMDKDDN
jgi:hypothetical protein